MRTSPAVLRGVFGLSGLLAVAAATPSSAARDAGHYGAHAALERHLASERVRLRAHFDSVLVELEVRETDGLTSGQRRSRGELVSWLREYRDAGAFPLNDLGTTSAVPIFRDSRGVHCAMAYLVLRSGRADLVQDIATTRNTAYVRSLVNDGRLVAWLDSMGLAEAEAARIQPTYAGAPATIERDYVLRSMLLGSLSVGLATANLLKPSDVRGWVGLFAGGYTIVRETQRGQYAAAGGRFAEGSTLVRARRQGDEQIKAFGLVTGSLAVLGSVYALTRPDDVPAAGLSRLTNGVLGNLLLSTTAAPGSGEKITLVGLHRSF